MTVKLGIAFAIALLPLASCTRAPERPRVFVGNPSFALGGEAVLSGTLVSSRGCLSLRDEAGQIWTLVFDSHPQLRVSQGRYDLQLKGEHFSLPGDARVSAVGAVLREPPGGWSIKSLRKQFYPRLPDACVHRIFYVKILQRNPSR